MGDRKQPAPQRFTVFHLVSSLEGVDQEGHTWDLGTLKIPRVQGDTLFANGLWDQAIYFNDHGQGVRFPLSSEIESQIRQQFSVILAVNLDQREDINRSLLRIGAYEISSPFMLKSEFAGKLLCAASAARLPNGGG